MTQGSSYQIEVGGHQFGLVNMNWTEPHPWSLIWDCRQCNRRRSEFFAVSRAATARAQVIAMAPLCDNCMEV